MVARSLKTLFMHEGADSNLLMAYTNVTFTELYVLSKIIIHLLSVVSGHLKSPTLKLLYCSHDINDPFLAIDTQQFRRFKELILETKVKTIS